MMVFRTTTVKNSIEFMSLMQIKLRQDKTQGI